MVSIGKKIKYLRKLKGITQEELSDVLHISYQAISKWENEVAQPDISIIPVIANYFGVTIDELFGFKLNALTNKERFIQFMVNNGMLKIVVDNDSSSKETKFSINTEKFETNDQISKVGGFFADFIRDNNLEYDTLVGLAYHGIAFSSAASIALYEKYGMTVNYCHDRLVPDSRGRIICGHTLSDKEKVIFIDDLIFSGSNLIERIERLRKLADIEVTAVIVIADFMSTREGDLMTGAQRIEEKYGTKVYSIITKDDITRAIRDDIIAGGEYLM
ncbi:helix-turn-helix domain-containing protein [Anaerocolumna sp. AGMB13025]|uniref:helix-turn-helix domain-containing protein n=1 Tax=Anaerocolumna sp. AGMB13025 TaxID=3039116 RepID=UPI00241CFD4F|nr:helix-turn-helix domain-containing protein [Anaerocolumna sp. AGMB13025]WFR58903.1 helix-turn-helix domain-containing protein [Anaerocolumna sp. AGMB13025]